jgi:IS1 family transposase
MPNIKINDDDQSWKKLSGFSFSCQIIKYDLTHYGKPYIRLGSVAKIPSGKISYIERFNNTLRHRVGRLVRKALSFSKKFENHILQ